MTTFRALGKDIILYGVMGSLSRSVNLLLLPILTRQFTPDQYGSIDVIGTMTSLAAVLISLNLESAVARLWFDSALAQGQRRLTSTVLAVMLSAGLGMMVFMVSARRQLSAVLLHDESRGSFVVLGGITAMFFALSSVPQVVLRMQRRITMYNVLSGFQSVLYVAVALLFVVRLKMGLHGVFVAQALAGGISLCAGLLFIKNVVGGRLSLHAARGALHYSVPLLPANAAVWVNGQADRVILLTFVGLGAVGVFGAASRLVMVMGLLISVFQQAWMPISIAMIDTEDRTHRASFYRRALNYYCACMFVAALMFTACSKELIGLLAPHDYLSGYVVVPWLAGAQVLQGSASITNLGMLISKRTFGNSVAAWAGAVANIIVCLALIPALGVQGAAFGAFVAAGIFTGLLWRYSAREANLRFDTKAICATVGCFVIACTAILWIYRSDWTLSASRYARALVVLSASAAMLFWTVPSADRTE